MARPSDFIVIATIVCGAVTAAGIDLRTRRVPNALNAALVSIGALLAITGLSGISVVAAAAGLGLGLALMLPGFLFGATGAGDVKLFAAMGTLVGPAPILRAFLFTRKTPHHDLHRPPILHHRGRRPQPCAARPGRQRGCARSRS